MMQDSLGGNSKTVIIATVAPNVDSYSETLSTLRFAKRAKSIRNQVSSACCNTGGVCSPECSLSAWSPLYSHPRAGGSPLLYARTTARSERKLNHCLSL
jgi:hypothetical protein